MALAAAAGSDRVRRGGRRAARDALAAAARMAGGPRGHRGAGRVSPGCSPCPRIQTYGSSPVRYTTEAIVRGRVLYAANCAACHGSRRSRRRSRRRVAADDADGSDRARVATREGELFWWIAHGIPGTPMPAFAPRLRDDDIWNLIQFLHAQAEAREAMAMTDRIKPLRAIVGAGLHVRARRRPQESLRQLRGERRDRCSCSTRCRSRCRACASSRRMRRLRGGAARE